MNPQSTITLRSGARMPVLGLGTWQLVHDTAGTVACALELGYRLIDTACDYGSQTGIGAALERYAQRERIYVVAKIEEDDDPLRATRKYLGEMRLDHADLMLIHRPPHDGAGESLWRGLMDARAQGLTRDIGVSNYSVAQIHELAERTGELPAVNQIEWSPFGHDAGMLQFCRQKHIVLQAYSPLTRTERLDDERLVALAAHYRKSPAQLLIRWNLQLGTVPIPKANRPEHLAENIDVFEFHIEPEEMESLGALNRHYSSLGSLPYVARSHRAESRTPSRGL